MEFVNFCLLHVGAVYADLCESAEAANSVRFLF